MPARSTASDQWHRESEWTGIEWDRAELLQRHAPLPPLAPPQSASFIHPDFPENIGDNPQAFAAFIQEMRRARWDDESLNEHRGSNEQPSEE